jgi:hypothetical protein
MRPDRIRPKETHNPFYPVDAGWKRRLTTNPIYCNISERVCHGFFKKSGPALDKPRKRGILYLVEQLLNYSESEESYGSFTGMRM